MIFPRYRPPRDSGPVGVAIGDATDRDVVGSARGDHALADHAALRAGVPDAVREALCHEGLVHPQPAIPVDV